MRLTQKADVLLHNMRPKVVTKLRLRYEDFQATHPHLIYCGAYGFRKEGPLADKPAYDDIIQAASGLNVTQAAVGASILTAGGSGGSTATGISGMYAASVSAPSAPTDPFRVVGLVTQPPGANGTDTASNANYIIVAFLNVSTKTLVTI